LDTLEVITLLLKIHGEQAGVKVDTLDLNMEILVVLLMLPLIQLFEKKKEKIYFFD